MVEKMIDKFKNEQDRALYEAEIESMRKHLLEEFNVHTKIIIEDKEEKPRRI